MPRSTMLLGYVFSQMIVLAGYLLASETTNAGVDSKDSATIVAAEVDRLIHTELQKGNIPVAERCNDEDFLRRASLDITGHLPSPSEVLAFRGEANPDKRSQLINRLIDSTEFGTNWARYWRDVIYIRATEQRSRFNQEEFTTWMADQWNKGTGWNQTVTAMLTAVGNVEEHPETALIFAQGATTEDVTAEACRVFLGIQLQCANCHDHPSDIWKREQFHQLAAYFPRITERRLKVTDGKPEFEIASVNVDNSKRGEFMREHPDLFIARFDRNKDHQVSKEEMKSGPIGRGKKAAAMNPEMKENVKVAPKLIDVLFANGDTNRDGLLSVAEINAMPAPGMKRRGSPEHHMVDLKNPNSEGELIDPKFFVDGSSIPHGMSDEDRRSAVAKSFTTPDNPWFARAIVNRVWAEMLGEGFYMPVDDLGPNRTARYPEALDVICKSFVATGYNPKWLVRTVASTEAYQRKIRLKSMAETDLPFASATPVPLRSDTIFNSLTQVFGVTESDLGAGRMVKVGEAKKGKEKEKAKEMAGASETSEMKDKDEMKAKEVKEKPRAFLQSPRFLFNFLFGSDPSIPKDEITGNIPQSLMMMNSRKFRAGMAAKGPTRLGKILAENKDNDDALREVYLLVLAREPSSNELQICSEYISEVKARPEAFEDLMWSLLNSSEFISRR